MYHIYHQVFLLSMTHLCGVEISTLTSYAYVNPETDLLSSTAALSDDNPVLFSYQRDLEQASVCSRIYQSKLKFQCISGTAALRTSFMCFINSGEAVSFLIAADSAFYNIIIVAGFAIIRHYRHPHSNFEVEKMQPFYFSL